MKKLTIIILFFGLGKSIAQTKNFIDLPHIETSATADTLVTPDRIYLNIFISEKDTRDNKSIEELEFKMNEKLKSLGIVTEKQLTLNDLGSNYKKYFLKQKDIIKNKFYTLLVYDAVVASKVLMALEELEISNVTINRTEYSKAENMLLILKSNATLKAKNQAIALTKTLNQKVGNAIYISDFSQMHNQLNGNISGVLITGYNASREKEVFNPVNIEFEKIKLETNVKVIFKLE